MVLRVVNPGIELPCSAGGRTLAVRLQAHNFSLLLVTLCGRPVVSTSVNTAGSLPEIDPDVIRRKYRRLVDAIFTSGMGSLGTPSTIVDTCGGPLRILREGIISAREIDEL